jgi:hypothetical protein
MGDWYLSRRAFPIACPRCRCVAKENLERMAVCEYLPALDHGHAQAQKHPGWSLTGWLAWYECTQCGATRFAPVSRAQVAKRGRDGWERV